MPAAAFLPPQKPIVLNEKTGLYEKEVSFKIVINSKESKTKTRAVSLELISGSDTVNMAITEDPEFIHVSIEPYRRNKEYTLSEGEGEKTIYVKFYTKWGHASEIISDSIIYKKFTGEDIEGEESGDIEGEISGDIKKGPFFNINKFLGRVIFQTGNRDKIWYVNPSDQKKYSIENPFRMFSVMKHLSLGATHNLINRYLEFPKRLIGRILLDVEDNGKVYYINPSDNKRYYLGKPKDAFNVLKGFSIGILGNDIEKIETGEIENED